MLEMKLHESISIDSYTWALRVPSGWIYNLQSDDDDITMRSVFVPKQ